jgi:hypothetical protein
VVRCRAARRVRAAWAGRVRRRRTVTP